MKKAVYPGTFDPFTLGHLNIVERGLEVFDLIIIAVNENSKKKCLFEIDERINLISETLKLKKIRKVKVKSFNTLLVDFLKKEKIYNLIRGVRLIDDFNYELQMSLINRDLLNRTNTFLLPSPKEYIYISSSMIKEIALYNGCLKNMLPDNVEKKVRIKINQIKK